MLVRARIGAAGVLIAALTLVGCQSGNTTNPVRVSGKVTYNGGPVGGGMITFHAADGTPVQVPIGPDGSYLADGLPEGEMAVTVETETVNPANKTADYRSSGSGMAAKYGKSGGGGGGSGVAQAAPKGGAPKSPMPEGHAGTEPTYVKIPPKYKEKATSGLSVNLKKGKQTYDIPLTD